MLALALALTLAAAPAAPPRPHAPLLSPPVLRAWDACHNIDPKFVVYVAPATRAPGGNPLLWLIGGSAASDDRAPAGKQAEPGLGPRYLDFQPAIEALAPATPAPPACARVIPAQ